MYWVHLQLISIPNEKNWVLKKVRRGFPGGSVVKNLSANARDMGSIPDLGRSHMLWATKSVCQNYRACAPQQEKPPQGEVGALQLEKSLSSSEDPARPKVNKF